jgi:hypothetical protein
MQEQPTHASQATVVGVPRAYVVAPTGETVRSAKCKSKRRVRTCHQDPKVQGQPAPVEIDFARHTVLPESLAVRHYRTELVSGWFIKIRHRVHETHLSKVHDNNWDRIGSVRRTCQSQSAKSSLTSATRKHTRRRKPPTASPGPLVVTRR